MTIEVKPKFEHLLSDDPAAESAGEVTPTRWNLGSDITQATNRLLGRLSSGAGATEELTGQQVAEWLQAEAAFIALTDGATVSLDWQSVKGRTLVMGGNRTLANPTNVKPGTSRLIYITGDSATERTLSYGSNYAGPLPDETVTSTVGLLLTLTSLTTTLIVPTWKVVEL